MDFPRSIELKSPDMTVRTHRVHDDGIVEDGVCTACNAGQLQMKKILVALDPRTYSLSGYQTKLSAREGFRLECQNCDWVSSSKTA